MIANALVPWEQTNVVALPSNAPPPDIVSRAVLLSPRDRSALEMAFQNEAYEMAATFVWSKGMAALKKQLAGLGMEFVGEMLGRTDLHEASNPITDIREDEAIELAEQLNMISTTEALRLRNGQMLVNHFLDPEVSHSEQMHREEAISVVRSCIVNFLADSNEHVRQSFVKLRKKLETETLNADAQEAEQLAASPYFFIRTTLTVLLTQLKVALGAKLEHAAGNIHVLLPVMWPKLRDKDRWQTGETYALVQAANRLIAAAGLRRALLSVNGFDFVPETLRSETFRKAARAVLGAHMAWDNFYNERKPMETLAQLGSSVPGPALADCMAAALCVRLGNSYGYSHDAQPAAERFLKLFHPPQWEYYLNKALTGDRYILTKLAYDEKPLERWQELVAEFHLDKMNVDARIAKMVVADAAKRRQIKMTATGFRERIMQTA
jgi:hypothetical protein